MMLRTTNAVSTTMFANIVGQAVQPVPQNHSTELPPSPQIVNGEPGGQPSHPILARLVNSGVPSNLGIWSARILTGGLVLGMASPLEDIVSNLFDRSSNFSFSLIASAVAIYGLVFVVGFCGKRK